MLSAAAGACFVWDTAHAVQWWSQASGTAFDAEHPPVLQQWVPADMVDSVKPVEVDGTRPQHLQRQLIGINFKPAAHQA